MNTPPDAGALRAPGRLSPLPSVPSPSSAPAGRKRDSQDDGNGGALPASLTAFIASVRRRRVSYDIATAAVAAGLCGTLVAVVALAVVLAVTHGGSGGSGSSGGVGAAIGWLTGARVIVIAIIAAAAGAALLLVKRAPAWRERAVIDRVEADRPACGNLLVTAYELTREPVMAPVKPYIRARVLGDAVRVAEAIDLGVLSPWRTIGGVAGLGALALVVAMIALAFVTTRLRPGVGANAQAARGVEATQRGGNGRSAPAVPPAIQHVAIDIIPPAYVGLPTTTLRDPERLDVLAGSRLRVRVDAIADELTLALDGLAAQTIARHDGDVANAGVAHAGASASAGSSTFTQELTPVQSGVLAIGARTQGIGDGSGSANAPPAAAHRLIAVTLTPDQPPVVTITVPGHDLMASDPQGRVRFVANATDDFGLHTLTLHYTKVSGSGERFEFKEAELPLTITRSTARSWEGSAERALHDLNVDVGDTIVYYAAATDNRPGQERAVSDSYVIEINQTGAAIAGGFAVPKDEDVFAISLNALIQKTEKLHGKRATMPAPEFAQAAAGLAIEQRMVRSEFLFSMGTHGRVEDEEEEAENSNEIQEGRLHNKGQSELTQAVDLMTLAERNLTDANTGDALKAQRAALAAVQRAQSRQRYFLRTIPIASRIDQTRRLTGNLSEAASSQHPAAPGPQDTRAAALRALLTDCARLTALLSEADPASSPTASPRVAAPGAIPSSAGSTRAAAPNASPASAASSPAPAAAAPHATDLASSIGARMMALDPTSTALHAAAASLLQVAPLAARGRADEARAIVRSAAALLVPLAQRAGAGTTAMPAAQPDADASTADPALRGAVVDALRQDLSKTGGRP